MEHTKHPILDSLKALLGLFKKKPAIIQLESTGNQPTIYVANHAAANGPFTYELFFPYRFVPWGTHEMCGNISERWNYLYHVFYKKKQGFSPLKSFLIATPFCVISKMLYRGAELIPTYKDLRLSTTIKHSIQAMQNGKNVLIFPENSEDVGYCENIDRFHRGFVLLARRFQHNTGCEVPICPVYYNGKRNRMVIGRPVYLRELHKQGVCSDDMIANFFRDRLNQLNRDYASV